MTLQLPYQPGAAHPSTSQFDIGTFYSEPIHAWKQIIGEELHYHFGHYPLGNEDFQTGLRRAVRDHLEFIPVGGRVLDAGCGWGGPAKLLTQEHGCSVQCVTISSGQAKYVRQLGLNVWQRDLETSPLEGEYDVALMHEVLSHIHDKQGVLLKLRPRARRLVITVNCCADDYTGDRTRFGGSMKICSVSELRQYVTAAGWKIRHMRERRRESMPTFRYWLENITRVYGHRSATPHIELLRQLSQKALADPDSFCRNRPLVDLIAD
jgi:hypothetical protein